MKYTQLIEFKDNEYEIATAESVEEAKPVIEAGFENVAEKIGIMMFGKLRRFVSLEM